MKRTQLAPWVETVASVQTPYLYSRIAIPALGYSELSCDSNPQIAPSIARYQPGQTVCIHYEVVYYCSLVFRHNLLIARLPTEYEVMTGRFTIL